MWKHQKDTQTDIKDKKTEKRDKDKSDCKRQRTVDSETENERQTEKDVERRGNGCSRKVKPLEGLSRMKHCKNVRRQKIEIFFFQKSNFLLNQTCEKFQ